MMLHDLYAEGAAAAAGILRDVYKVDVYKALDPLKHDDFAKITRHLAKDLKGLALPVEAKALKHAVEMLDVDWHGISMEARGAVVAEAQKYISDIGPHVMPALEQKLSVFAKDLGATTKKNTVLAHDLKISTSLNATDERIMKFAADSQGHYVRDAFGKRADEAGDTARFIVSSGLEDGLGSADISAKLSKYLGDKLGRTDSYWTTIAMVFANRARTSVQLFAFAEAGIETYTWESVLDEVTSLQCRFMHGRQFSVGGAVQSIHAVEDGGPESIKLEAPFLNVSGNRLYAQIGDGPTGQLTVAQSIESAVGQKDKIGTFSSTHTDKDLENLGIRMPPLHGRCRSTVIPAIAPLSPAAPPPPEPPPKVTPAQAKQQALKLLDDSSFNQLTDVELVFPNDHLPFDVSALATGKGATFEELVEANKISKKPKLDELVPTVSHLPQQPIEEFIKSPKKLDAAAKPLVVKKNGMMFIGSGHEALAAQKLLGQKTAYVDFVDFDKPLKVPAVAAHAIPATPPATPAASSLLTNPHMSVVWGKDAKHEDEILHGVKFSPAAPKEWDKIKDVDVKEPKLPDLKPGTKRSSGVVIVEDDGRVWLVEPKDHFGGYEQTFPKGKVDAGLSLQQNALKEAFEESGLDVDITGYLCDAEGTTSNTRYYVGRRRGGAPWKAHWESSTVRLVPPEEAELLLNTKRDKETLEKLKEYMKPKVDASVVLGTKLGSQQGSNEGGFYRGTDGIERYVKFYKDAGQAPAEHLANNIYNDLGHAAPKSNVFEHNGKQAYASEIIKDVKTLGSVGLTKENAREAMKGFVADVLVGNWDAAGQSLDNMVVGPGGNIIRIDNGGSFLMRAKNGRKDTSLLNKITEWEGFFDASTNAQYKSVAKAAGYNSAADMAKDHLNSEIEKVLSLRDAHGGWHGYVSKIAPGLPLDDKRAIVEMLEHRTALLEAKIERPKIERKPGVKISINIFDSADPVAVKASALINKRMGKEYYEKNIYGKAGIGVDDAREAMKITSRWTGEFRLGSMHQSVYKGSARAMLKKPGSGGSTEKVVEKMVLTREARWRAFLDEAGAKSAAVPTHLRVMRGMGGREYVLDVAKAWKDDTKTHATLQSHEVASWSWSKKKADEFRGDTGVRYHWDAPLEHTVFDQATDDSSFQSSFHHEHEVIAGPGHDKGLDLPKEEQVVALDGVEYEYKDRAKLFEALKKAGEPGWRR
jgi:ADP-ribose pyrophosphatase YjhB (NUDIX family)